MSSSFSEVRNILDLPDEILVEIILYLNARERLALADSCKRLNSLVFEYRALLKNLDFSKRGHLTTAANIQRYFRKEATRQFTIKVNVQNVECMNSGHMLNDLIGRAINLVDLNIHGTEFETVESLRSFLAPLLHLKRLSLDWPETEIAEFNFNKGISQIPFSKLKYLSLVLHPICGMLPPVVELCLELEELRMKILPVRSFCRMSLNSEPVKLKNLKVVQICGGHSASLKNDLMTMVPDSTEWTELHLANSPWEGYLERNVEWCDKFWDFKLQWKSLPYLNSDGDFQVPDKSSWNLLPDHLLEAAIRMTHEDVPKKFCCLNDEGDGRSCLLKIDEAKELLKDPGYQVSYLYINHTIGPNCDAHLVASAFPNVTELVFHMIHSKSSITSQCKTRKRPSKKRLQKKGSVVVPEERDDTTNSESSFKMLIENTPRVESLTLLSGPEERIELLDLDVLYLIPRWKNLRIIIFKEIPFEDGNFLVDIGKECQNLMEVQLLFPLVFRYHQYYYGPSLVQMLNHCTNLRKFSIRQSQINNLSEIFEALANKPKFEAVNVMSWTEKYDSPELITSIEQMLHRCPELTKFIIAIFSELDRVDAELRPGLERIVGKLNRHNFVFHGPNFPREADHEDTSTSFLSSPLDRNFY